MEYFAGKTVTMQQIYNQHHDRFTVGTRYIKNSYRECLIKLEADRKIQADPPARTVKKEKEMLHLVQGSK